MNLIKTDLFRDSDSMLLHDSKFRDNFNMLDSLPFQKQRDLLNGLYDSYFTQAFPYNPFNHHHHNLAPKNPFLYDMHSYPSNYYSLLHGLPNYHHHHYHQSLLNPYRDGYYGYPFNYGIFFIYE